MPTLAPCPKSPNCVNSADPDQNRAVNPLYFTCSREEAHQAILDILAAMPRTTVVCDQPDHIHAECRSRWFGFTDDLEFVFRENDTTIDIRSASRLGWSDFGMNHARVRAFRTAFEQRLPRR